MNTLWTTFACTIGIAKDWHLAILDLGGSVERGLMPELGAEKNWGDADWHVWRLGGYATVDARIYGGISFYIGRDSPIVASHTGSPTLLRLFKAMGATNFSSPHLVGEDWASEFEIVDQKPTRNNIEDISNHTVVEWPKNQSPQANQFLQQIDKRGSVVFETGPTYGSVTVRYYRYRRIGGMVARIAKRVSGMFQQD